MKIYKIVLFIFVTLFLLAIICYLFPAEGVTIGSLHFRFPSIEKILTRSSATALVAEEPVDTVETMEAAWTAREQELQNREDSLAVYKDLINNHISRIYLPDDDYTYFDSFFESAQTAAANGQLVRVEHYGDSQIELDRISSNLRSFFQSRFGGSGPGLLPVVQTVPTATVSQWASENLTCYTAYGVGNRDPQHYGLMAKYYRVNGSASSGFSRTRANRVRLLFYDRSGGFQTTLTLKDADTTFVRFADSTIGFKVFDWRLPSVASSATLHFTGNADLYGILADNGSGVAVDNIPMRGCSGTIFTQLGNDILRQSFQTIHTGMIILQYGGNAMPGMASKEGVDYYANQVGRQIRFLKTIYPHVPILFIGPSDMATRIDGELRSYPLLGYMVEALKRAALANGAAFWNIYEVMGGNGSIIRWTQQGLAGADYVHFSPAGANKIGNYLVDAFATIYDYYLMNKQTATIAKTTE